MNDRDAAIPCDICQFWIHLRCNNCILVDYKYLQGSPDAWFCLSCCSTILPFEKMTDKNFSCLVLNKNYIEISDKNNSVLLKPPLNFALFRAYSRPILCLTVKRCTLLQELCKALFWCKTLRKEIEWGSGLIFWDPFFKTSAFFQKKCHFFIEKFSFWPISNAALNFLNISCPIYLTNLIILPQINKLIPKMLWILDTLILRKSNN